MARTKHTARLVDEGVSDADLTYDFGVSRIAPGYLEDFAKQKWFSRASARHCEGEVKPEPRDDEVVLFKEFFEAGLRWPPHPLVIGALKKFNLGFHQLNPSSFVKISIYVWGCKSQGVEPDLEGFVRIHRVHPQPRKIEVDGKELRGQFGVCTFVCRTGAEVPAQAHKNKWASPWTENWFYLKLEDEPGLCGQLSKIEWVSVEHVATDECVAAVDALRQLSRHQCARDLVEEYVCARYVPLRKDQVWFEVRDDEKYRSWRLKYLRLDLRAAWKRVIEKGRTQAEGVESVYRIIEKEVDNLVGPLLLPELKLIKKALDILIYLA